MGIIDEIVAFAIEVTQNLDREVEQGYDLSRWGDLMKFLHALQVQVQALIDLAQVICSRLGRTPRTYLDAGRILRELGVLDDEDLKFYRSVVGFRNIVVHMYTRIDISLVDNILRSRQYRRVLELVKKLYEFARRQGLDC